MEEKIYLDDKKVGPARETSHPNFVNHFKNDFYYDFLNDEAPFGNDNGADALYELGKLIKSGSYIEKIIDFPRKLVSEIWDLTYIDPNDFRESDLSKLIEEDEYSLMITDQVIVATALGEIKILGKIELELKNVAIKAMERQKLVFKYLSYDGFGIYDKIIEDFKIFNSV